MLMPPLTPTDGSSGYVTEVDYRLTSHGQVTSVLHITNANCILAQCHTAFVQTEHLFHLFLAPPPQKLQSPQSIWSSLDFASAWVFSLVYSPSPPARLCALEVRWSRVHFSRSKNRLELIIIPGLGKVPPGLPGCAPPHGRPQNGCAVRRRVNGHATEIIWPLEKAFQNNPKSQLFKRSLPSPNYFFFHFVEKFIELS